MTSFGQVLDFEQAPPSVKWRQINTEYFQVIFPVEFENEAQELTKKMEAMITEVGTAYHKKPRKISIILHSRLAESNGFVGLAPRRSEFYPTPPQHSDFQKWTDQLAIHELRHVVQFDNLTSSLRAPFFEQLALAIFGVTLPPWFYEGDAVMTETTLSASGRGRLPSWEMPFRTNLLSGRNYSYQKDYLGSLKDITPGFYELGYFMVGKMQRDHGETIVDDLVKRVSRNVIRPYSFSNSLRKFTGFNTRQWHRETTSELKQIWHNQLEYINPESYSTFPAKSITTPENWLYPQALPDGSIIAIHRSAHRVPGIVTLQADGGQTLLINIGRQSNPHFSYADGYVVWDEIRTNSRFLKETYSIINSYNIQNGEYRQLTSRTRLFAPALSPDVRNVAAVEVDGHNNVRLVLLDNNTGKELSRFDPPENIMLQTPSFHPSGQKIVMTGISNSGATLLELDLKTGVFTQLIDWQNQLIERPVYAKEDIYFKAHYNGIDNIYRLNITSKRISQVTNAEFGAFHPSFDSANNRILFNHYQVDGYRISHLNIGEIAPKPIEEISDSFISYFKPLLSVSTKKTTIDTASSVKIESKPFNEVNNLVNFHSLSLSNGNPSSLDDFTTGIYWLSDNLLNTTQIRLGYEYDGDIRSHDFRSSISYQRFFPKFFVEYRNRGQVGAGRIISQGDTSIVGLRWRENLATFRMDIPLVFYRLNQVYTTGFSAGTTYTARYNLNREEFESRFVDRLVFPMHYQAYFNRNNRRSLLDLAPRWGQNFGVTYRHFPFDGNRDGEILSFRSSFYFPGLWRNHSIQARFNYQNGSGVYAGVNDIPVVSGFDQLRPSLVENTLLLNYRLPIAYPDWNMGSLAYIRRLKGGFFADFQNVGSGERFSPRTFGAEIRADVNFLRFYLPIFDIGAKLIYADGAYANKRFLMTYSIAYQY